MGGTDGTPLQYKCTHPDCTKTFTRQFNLRSHLASHSSQRPYGCPHCERTFSRKHDQQRHARLHTGYKPYTCPGCQAGFFRTDALRRHLKA
ncbi:hypothetical protein GQ42DRAFT_127440, partial [Ramicandelaber brevisporus]